MERICPICNSLETIHCYCPNCGQKMIDGGSLENYYGPYSPYIDRHMPEPEPDRQCVHLLYCPDCRYDLRIAYELIEI